MTPVGENLRRERLKRNLELDEISRELKISMRFLQALENDQYEKLPGGVFAKSFARQYARLLGLNEEDIAGQVQEILGPLPEPTHPSEKLKPPPIQVPKVDEWETVGDKRFQWSGWFSAVVLVAVMLVCSAVYAWLQRPKSTVTAQANPAVSNASPSVVQSASSPAPIAAQPPPNVTAPPPSPVIPSPVPAPTAEQRPIEQKPVEQKPVEQKPLEQKPAPAAARVTPPTSGATVRVEIVAEEAVWVLARADGKYAFSATMDPHSSRNVEGVKEVMLRLGNAGGVTISLNGKPIGPAGPKGQVRTIQFTSGGFQIVPAKPPSEPVDRL